VVVGVEYYWDVYFMGMGGVLGLFKVRNVGVAQMSGCPNVWVSGQPDRGLTYNQGNHILV